jgi:outer membrane protein assembly factor BamB
MNTMIKSLIILSLFSFQTFSLAGSVVSWSFKTGGSVYSKPLVVSDTVFIGSEDSTFYAIDFNKGSEIWHYKTENKILSTAAYSNNVVCFESGSVLYGLNMDGTEKWKVTISEGAVTNHYDEWDCYHSSPNIVDGVAYVGSEKGQVVGVNIQSGEEVFRIDTGDRGVGIHVKPAVYQNKIYFGECSGMFYCYDLATKEKVWVYDTNPEKLWKDPAILTDPVIKDSIIYFGGRHCHLYALNIRNGKKVWWYSDPNNMWILGGPVLSDSLLYIGSSNQQVLHCFNVNSRKLLWKKVFDGRIYANPFVQGENVFFGTGMEMKDKKGCLFAVNKNSGNIQNRFIVNSQVHSSPVVINNKIIFGSTNSFVYALNEQEMLNFEHPESGFLEQGDINIGKINQDTTISIGIANTSGQRDSVSFSWTGRGIAADKLEITPSNMGLAPLSQFNILVAIKASALPTGDYSIIFKMSRYFTLNPASQDITKVIKLTVPAVSSVNEDINKFGCKLNQNYPNPFNPSTRINYSIAEPSHVELVVFDTLGKKIATIINEYKNTGSYEVSFNASGIPSGIYYYKLKAGNYSSVKKLVVLK